MDWSGVYCDWPRIVHKSDKASHKHDTRTRTHNDTTYTRIHDPASVVISTSPTLAIHCGSMHGIATTVLPSARVSTQASTTSTSIVILTGLRPMAGYLEAPNSSRFYYSQPSNLGTNNRPRSDCCPSGQLSQKQRPKQQKMCKNNTPPWWNLAANGTF